ncbi:MAG: orotidine-5'-phosphate decarboxylase [Rhodospirillales bacterium]|nr:MAG: orotidine-5'-phosphate decarboxylase [Rhodospirillales bacterium]
MGNANPIYAAVDTTDLTRAAKLIRRLTDGAPAVGGIKLGLEFFLAHGAPGIRYAFPEPVRLTGVGFFLDLKLHDIPNTVAGGIRAVAELAPTYITIHAAGGPAMLKAAVAEAADAAARLGVVRTRLLGVTVLTSLDDSDLAATGVADRSADQVKRLALLARDSGLDGVICSPREIAPLRAVCGPDFELVTPGIRPSGAAVGDQKRVMTPRDAMRAGATALVVGRPISEAADPRQAALDIAYEADLGGKILAQAGG